MPVFLNFQTFNVLVDLPSIQMELRTDEHGRENIEAML
jgi:hypothetical protein